MVRRAATEAYEVGKVAANNEEATRAKADESRPVCKLYNSKELQDNPLRNEDANTSANGHNERLGHHACQPLPKTQERENEEDPSVSMQEYAVIPDPRRRWTSRRTPACEWRERESP